MTEKCCCCLMMCEQFGWLRQGIYGKTLCESPAFWGEYLGEGCTTLSYTYSQLAASSISWCLRSSCPQKSGVKAAEPAELVSSWEVPSQWVLVGLENACWVLYVLLWLWGLYVWRRAFWFSPKATIFHLWSETKGHIFYYGKAPCWSTKKREQFF